MRIAWQTDELTPVHDAFGRLRPNRSPIYTTVVTVMSLLAVKSVSTQGDTLSDTQSADLRCTRPTTFC